ncbi:hypothetical protein BUALT_Bualt15G0029500 [Buddleja alternifolia]|uniref:Plastid division protein PDV2 n=1 Tax=Buddleja alternifolia TaxID=168488 RepID=A0AAV6WCT6_9LAMI|nr:hypothetical protein BUALT_Bualt15G0029500 [Buddleja alternifolia]
MDEDRIGLVLAKTSELRSKIINCIHKTCSNVDESEASLEEAEKQEDDVVDEGEGEESLLNIKDALESLEAQLSSLQFDVSCLKNLAVLHVLLDLSLNLNLEMLLLYGYLTNRHLLFLPSYVSICFFRSMRLKVPVTSYFASQALQQQQWYEKEAALAEIEHSQKKLLKELKEYKGKDFEVIHEAIAFASETEDKNDLLLPPYPSRPSQSSLSNNSYLSTSPPTRKFPQNGLKNKVANNFQNTESDRSQSGSWGPFKRLQMFVGAAAKATLTIVGVIAILSMAGFEPRARKRDNEFKRLELFQNNEKDTTVDCPPGKLSVMENGEMRCVVKERVEIPFDSVVDTPDVSYGCG